MHTPQRIDIIVESERRFPAYHDELEYARRVGFIAGGLYLKDNPADSRTAQAIASARYPELPKDPRDLSITLRRREGASQAVTWMREEMSH